MQTHLGSLCKQQMIGAQHSRCGSTKTHLLALMRKTETCPCTWYSFAEKGNGKSQAVKKSHAVANSDSFRRSGSASTIFHNSAQARDRWYCEHQLNCGTWKCVSQEFEYRMSNDLRHHLAWLKQNVLSVLELDVDMASASNVLDSGGLIPSPPLKVCASLIT